MTKLLNGYYVVPRGTKAYRIPIAISQVYRGLILTKHHDQIKIRTMVIDKKFELRKYDDPARNLFLVDEVVGKWYNGRYGPRAPHPYVYWGSYLRGTRLAVLKRDLRFVPPIL
jgi:hypothetical protein